MRRRRLLLVSFLLVVATVSACGGVPVTSESDGAEDAAPSIESRLSAIEAQLDAISIRLAAENVATTVPPGFMWDAGVVETTDSFEAGTISVTVSGLEGYRGGDLAGVVQRDSDGVVVGGFSTDIDASVFTTTQQVREIDATSAVAGWPPVTEQTLLAEPGRYVLLLFADTGLGAYSRWFPINTDGHGLIGCIQLLDVVEGMATSVTVDGDLDASGFGGICNAPRER